MPLKHNNTEYHEIYILIFSVILCFSVFVAKNKLTQTS